MQRVIELTFADEDVQVVAVGDGDQAIARLDAEPPDIVLVDVGMPGKNGYEVAAYMKHTPRLAHIPVLLLTGASEPVDRARADSLKCDGVLAKPFEPQLVIGRVKELLGRRGRPAPPADGKAATPAASGAAVTEDLVEQVTRRVLERLSDRIVRETAAEIVTGVAERLVREEIEKLKSAIK